MTSNEKRHIIDSPVGFRPQLMDLPGQGFYRCLQRVRILPQSFVHGAEDF